ncbi:lipid-A-disaccharide synthase [Lichenihabitans sp. Uapishka_5]|uniref:lipid-A-disaccharide synthase n=1 Tax=Lichenihabitans sp. Uapishka_5 TaxID=3037302 RepID=UPI0029E81218|nr:lipid-A-disaccharide synthase [Lichenihabitans sp. Uapishka_5]MDX7951997.1 lipid-A-disaccharide synthase [Lichenihabitans sp. Uapishka_5]
MSRYGLRIALIAGEHSGDQLGFKLMQALRAAAPVPVDFVGVGGERMEAEGLHSHFPLADIAVMGFAPVIRKLPTLLRRIRAAASAVIAAEPDALVIIDSPDFTHRVAKLVRRARPKLPIIDYVSPSVWAWRQGRAKRMRAYTDHVLALLPFEPEAHRRLGGPACTYVGHPLIERLDELRPDGAEQARRAGPGPVVLVLPGSRRSEIRRLSADFGAALGLLAKEGHAFEPVLPAVPHLIDEIRSHVARWPVQPRIVEGEAAKLSAFREARVALAASGTVTLELALAGVPTVVAYRVAPFETWLKYVIKVPSIVLPNLILGHNAVPEFIQHDCTPERLAAALAPLLGEGEVRAAQVAAFAKLAGLMRLEAGEMPSGRAAAIVLALAGRTRGT